MNTLPPFLRRADTEDFATLLIRRLLTKLSEQCKGQYYYAPLIRVSFGDGELFADSMPSKLYTSTSLSTSYTKQWWSTVTVHEVACFL